MNNVKIMLKTILELEALGISPKTSAKPLGEIYLVSLDKDYIAALSHPEFVKLNSLNNLGALISWQSAYGIIFGRTETEKILLEAKEKAFKNLTEVLGDNFSVENAMRHKDNPHILTLLGYMFYYGLDFDQNEKLGTDYLNHAATLNDVDALIWKLWAYPKNAEQTICDMAVLPEFMAEPAAASLELFKQHYGIDKNIDVNLGILKIGFN